MLRDVVVGGLRDGADPARLAALDLPGLVSVRVRRGRRDLGGSFASTGDRADEDAYRDLDGEHDRVRREPVALMAEQIVRVQIALPQS